MYSVFSRVESVGPDEHDPADLVVRLAPMPGLVDPTLRIARDHIDGYLAVVGVTSASDLIGLSVRVSVAPDDSTEHIAFLPATRPADASQGFLVLRDSRPANQVTVYDLVGYAPPVAPPVPAAGSFGATSSATSTANGTPDQVPTGSAAEEAPAGGATAEATTAGADAVGDDADVAAAYAAAFGSATASAPTEAVTSADGTAGVAPSDAAADVPVGDAIGQVVPDGAATAIDTPTAGDAGATEASAVTPESPTETTEAIAETAPSSAGPSASPVAVEDECPEAAPKLTPEDQEAEERARAEIAATAQQPVGQRYFLYRETYGKSAHGAAIELTPEEFAALGGPAYVHLEDCGIANMQFIPADVAQDIERLLARTIMRPETELSRSDVEHLAANGRVVSVAVY